jgi:transposase
MFHFVFHFVRESKGEDMAETLLINEALWSEIQSIIPQKRRRHRYPGRFPIGDREVLTGILFVMETGISWHRLPLEMGCGCGMTCWRRLRDWKQVGVWQAMLDVIFKYLDDQGRIDWSRAYADSATSINWRKKHPVRAGGAIDGAHVYGNLHMGKVF